MMELGFEIMGAVNLLTALFYWVRDENDIMHWLFYLLVSAIMYINAFRYGKGDE
jgi:hypothetical protein